MKKNKFFVFALSFVGALFIFVTILHIFETRGGPPLSWAEIFDDWLFFVISSVIMALLVTVLWISHHPKNE